jgi:hypothetical protein
MPETCYGYLTAPEECQGNAGHAHYKRQQHAKAGKEVTFQASAFDPDGDNLTFSIEGAPEGATFDPEAGAFAWTPTTQDTEGEYVFTGVVTDDGPGNLSVWQTVVVLLDNTPPVTTRTLEGEEGNVGWFVSPVNVTLSAAHELSGVATTEYRINDPNGEWLMYQEPFVIDTYGLHTLEFRSIDVAGNKEPAEATEIRIDTVAPVTTATLGGEEGSGWFLSPVTVTLDATDAASGVASIEFRHNDPDGQWETYTGPFEVATEGTHEFEYRGIDAAGNVEQISSVSFQIEATPPATMAYTMNRPPRL